jgi:hypothetical protein
VSDFFQPPPPVPTEQAEGGNAPPWTGRPQGSPPGEVLSEVVLSRSETATLSIAYLDAYPDELGATADRRADDGRRGRRPPHQGARPQRPQAGYDARNYESEIRIHFARHFGQKPVDEITADDVEDFIDACLDAGERTDRGLAELSVKTVRNLYVHLNGIFEFAISKGWAHANPWRAVDKPASPEDDDTEIHFLDQAELDALLAPRSLQSVDTHRRRWPAPHKRGRSETLSGLWQQVGERLGCSAATAIYLYRATPDAVLEHDLARRPSALPHRRNDRPAPGRAARPPMARRRLVGAEDPRRPAITLRARRKRGRAGQRRLPARERDAAHTARARSYHSRAMTAQEKLRERIETLTEEEAAETRRLLDRRTDPLSVLLDSAPLDDEPVTPEEEAGVAEARAEIARCEVISAEEIRREFA